MERSVDRLRAGLSELYESFGYGRYRMGRFEEYALYMENRDFMVSDRVIAFTDIDGRLMALKPDVTLSIVKSCACDPDETEKAYYLESVFRPGSEGFRELEQTGLEALGRVDGCATCEVLYLAGRSLALSGGESALSVGHMGMLTGLAQGADITGEGMARMLSALRGRSAHGAREAARALRLDEKRAEALVLLACLYGDLADTVKSLDKIIFNDTMREAAKELTLLARADVAEKRRLRLDFSALGDERYYSGLVFKGYLRGLPSPVLSGGRYDGLTRKMGKSGGGIGFALYMGDLEDREKTRPECDLFIEYGENADPGAVLKQLREASSKGLRARAGRKIPAYLTVKEIIRAEDTLC